jgi:hypothetical protein
MGNARVLLDDNVILGLLVVDSLARTIDGEAEAGF